MSVSVSCSAVVLTGESEFESELGGGGSTVSEIVPDMAATLFLVRVFTKNTPTALRILAHIKDVPDGMC